MTFRKLGKGGSDVLSLGKLLGLPSPAPRKQHGSESLAVRELNISRFTFQRADPSRVNRRHKQPLMPGKTYAHLVVHAKPFYQFSGALRCCLQVKLDLDSNTLEILYTYEECSTSATSSTHRERIFGVLRSSRMLPLAEADGIKSTTLPYPHLPSTARCLERR